jgi:hypothetical protein
MPAYLVQRLQSVLNTNASARIIYGLRRHDHVSDALVTLHWLKIPERINSKRAVLVHRNHHGAASESLRPLRRVADLPGCRSLRSASTNQLVSPFTRLTVGTRSFPVAGPSIWNSLPADVTSSDSLPDFRRRLKTVLSGNLISV